MNVINATLSISSLCEYLLSRNNTSEETLTFCREYLADPGPHRPLDDEIVLPSISRLSLSILITLYSVVIVLSLLANTAVIFIYVRSKSVRSVTNVFMISLAVSDLCVTVVCLPMDIWFAATTYWPIGIVGCKVIPVIQFAAVSISSVTLCCIAVDRYSVIMHPLRARASSTGRAVFMLIAVWCVSLLCSVPCGIFYERVPLVYEGQEVLKPVHHVCAWSSESKNIKLYTDCFIFVVLFAIPFLTMTISYIRIGRFLLVRSRVGVHPMARLLDNSVRQRRRAVKMLILVVTVFTLSWAPLLIFKIVADVIEVDVSELTMNLRHYLSFLATSNTLYNPLVYIFTNDKFKAIFMSRLKRRTLSSTRHVHLHVAIVAIGSDRRTTNERNYEKQ